jgi:uncharacterized protein (DUF1778 family)
MPKTRPAKRTQKKLVLSERDREAFVSALVSPPTPAKTLRRAAKRYLQRTGR